MLSLYRSRFLCGSRWIFVFKGSQTMLKRLGVAILHPLKGSWRGSVTLAKFLHKLLILEVGQFAAFCPEQNLPSNFRCCVTFPLSVRCHLFVGEISSRRSLCCHSVTYQVLLLTLIVWAHAHCSIFTTDARFHSNGFQMFLSFFFVI